MDTIMQSLRLADAPAIVLGQRYAVRRVRRIHIVELSRKLECLSIQPEGQ